MMEEEELTYILRGAIYDVFVQYGPGLYESIYELALKRKLEKKGIQVQSQVPLPFYVEGEKMEIGFRIDLLVENRVIIEIKSVENLAEVHHKQLLTYLKLSGKKVGLLVNFNSNDILKSIHRKIYTY